jgi:hypothetical protein
MFCGRREKENGDGTEVGDCASGNWEVDYITGGRAELGRRNEDKKAQ